MDKTFFTKKNYSNKRMHARVLGILSRAAFECGIDVEIGRSLSLREPLKHNGRKQWHATSDIALRHKECNEIFGVVEYESVDITRLVLHKKLDYFERWRNNEQGQSLRLVISIITEPDYPYWGKKQTAREPDFKEFRDDMRKLTEGSELECIIGIISYKTGLSFFKSFAGKEIPLSCKWSG